MSDQLRLVLPKGRIFDGVRDLLAESGLRLDVDARGYRPVVNDDSVHVKIMKPQNVPELLALGSHDVGFTGLDWVQETSSQVEELLDLKFDPVRLIAAVPEGTTIEDLKGRERVVCASEYEHLTKRWLERQGFERAIYLRTWGATEVFPPDDADLIVDNTATGRTLAENDLDIVDVLLESSTRFVASPQALENPAKRERVEHLLTVFKSILAARKRVMLEMNVPKDRLEALIDELPSMRAPTVSPLYHEDGYAVKVALDRDVAARLVPRLSALGATDVLEYELRKVVA